MLLTGRPTGTAGWGWDDRLLHQRRHNWSSDLLEQNSPWFVWKVGPWNTYVEIKLYIIQYVYVYKYIYILYIYVGLYKTGYIFKWPKIRYRFFYSYRFLWWWAPCRQEVGFVQGSVGGMASLVESQQMSSFVFISFYHLSICIHFLSCSFDVAFSCCINFLSFCGHVLSCSVAMYQRYRS
jgi:hypothetical protein